MSMPWHDVSSSSISKSDFLLQLRMISMKVINNFIYSMPNRVFAIKTRNQNIVLSVKYNIFKSDCKAQALFSILLL